MHERAAAVGITARSQGLQQLVPGIQRQQQRQRAHIEDQDAIDHLVDGLGNDSLGVIGLGGGNADHFQATEGKQDKRHGHQQPACAMGEEPAMGPQVAQGRLLAAGTAHQQITGQGDHAHNRHHLDDGKPELHFTECLDVGEVDQVDQHEERRGRGPGRYFRPPVLHVFAHGSQFGHAHQHVHDPVIPARQKTRERAPIPVREITERAGHRLLHHHFAQLAHDQEGDEAGNRIAQHHRWASRFQHPGRTQE
ncbi:hypothetical protein D9M71_497720 [compost metagenome]